MAIKEASGKLTYLRVNQVGWGYGAQPDFLDAEAIVQLGDPNKAFGFQLRNDSNRVAHQGMLDLLRDAFDHNWTVTINYDIDPGKNNGRVVLVVLTK